MATGVYSTLPEASTLVVPCAPNVGVTVAPTALDPSLALTLMVTGVLTKVVAVSLTPDGFTVTFTVIGSEVVPSGEVSV